MDDDPGGDHGGTAGDRDREALVAAVHDHLAATAELPVTASASHHLGEAEALAADVAGDDVPPPVLERRLGHVRDLLDAVDETGSPAADDHVAAARRATERVLASLESEDGDDRRDG